jgi:2-oxoglutarate dehydrogenase E2 component (dihydrolipoamide succinyltransferase)
MGDSISEGVVEAYVKNIGEFVNADDIIARIETDKVTVDILAEHTGVITKWHSEIGDTVPVGANFVDIDPEAKPSASSPAAEPKKEDAPKPAASEPV